MKNLANCTSIEFLVQCNKIRKQVETWLKDTKILEIRKNTCELLPIKENMNPAQKELVEAENEKRAQAQARKNISDMLDAALEENAEKTFELLALMCFLTPEEAKDTKPFVLLNCFAEMLNDKDVMGFFSSLMKSGLIDTLNS